VQIRDRRSLVLGLVAFAAVTGATHTLAQDEDVVHIISGVVKHVDRGSKKLIVKTDEGTEHTIKWTGETTWEGTKESGKGIKEGSKLTVRYTEKAGEKTAVGVKDIGKETKNALE
jgi:Cu/Ag efflux protein CusF